MPANAVERIIESHEDRIQRLEGDLPELTAQVATVAIQQKELGGKMDQLQATMVDHAKTSGEKLDKVGSRVELLEKSKEQLDWLKKTAKFLATPGLLVGGALLAKFGDAIYLWIIHKP